jgi:ubiquinone/menaquinone biosynthesis C-methylase UbiE
VSGAMLERARGKFEEVDPHDRARFVQADLCDLSELPRNEFSAAVALGEPIGCATSPAKALKEIHRRLIDGGVLVASFDNRWAAIDYYLDRGQPGEMAEFLKTGKTRWLTRDESERFEIHTYGPVQLNRLLERAEFHVADMVGKTVLPLRRHRDLLADASQRRAWMKLEKRLWRDPAAIGRAAHIQVAAEKRPKG